MEVIQVLIVEDNLDNQKLATWILEDEGFLVSCADTAEDGLQMLEAKRYDVVLMDISLPGMDGKEATRKIRNTPHLANVPIIALTAHAVQQEKDEIKECGVDALLTKPLDEEKLVEQIQAILK